MSLTPHSGTMLHSHHHFTQLSPFPPLSPSRHHPPLIPFPCSPAHCLRFAPGGRAAVRATGLHQWVAELPYAASPLQELEGGGGGGGGPIELPPSSPSTLFAVDDNPSPLQVATSVLLTGAITVFLFRSLRRRAKRAKELRVRSTGMKKTKDIKEEALDSLKAMGVASVEAGAPPSPVQAMLGGIAAGAIALILYKFTVTVEASLNRQAISDNFSVRQITITIRTIVNGLCYLATFVFGINSIGLVLYSIQLAFSSFMESPTNNSESSKEADGQSNATETTKSTTDSVESRSSNMEGGSDDS